MGSSTSRLGSRPSRARLNRDNSNRSRPLFSCLFCGGFSSRNNSIEMEDYPHEVLISAEHCGPVVNEVRNTAEESSLLSRERSGASSESSMINLGTINQRKSLFENGELVAPFQVSHDSSHDDESYRNSSSQAGSSFEERQSSNSVSVNVWPNKDAVNGIGNLENKGASEICPEIVHSSSLSPHGTGDSCSDSVSVENHTGSEITSVFNSDLEFFPHSPDVPSTFQSLENESIHEEIPSGNGEWGQEDGSVLHVDVLSISSSIVSSSSADPSSHEARRNSRRLFWDAFPRRTSRRHMDSPPYVFSMDNSNDLASFDNRWVIDFGDDIFDDGISRDSRYLGSRIHSLNERRRQSRSEIWERLRGGLDEGGQQTTSCPSGLHPDGSCSCEPRLMADESSTRASISRIVMLAEALFEVLDEIHHQPVSLSLSRVSVPAPESVVDSFPLRNHKKLDKAEGSNDVEQCYICLAEYEEGEKIRVLPCHHEYHMSCVDKWLKEIHGVCPLCRGNVCQGAREPSIPSEIHPR